MDGGSASGGSAQLAVLIDKYGEFLLPDLKHYYDIDLRDLFSEVRPLSPRFVLAHIKNLDYDSAFVAESRGGQHFRGWDEGRYMEAAKINLAKAANYLFILANTDPKKSRPKPPEAWPIPDAQEKKKRADAPGSFGFISKDLLARAKKRKEGGV